ncbi:hypothetical protein KAM479_39810 [Aeromonas caviae]|jgi:polyhydroxyalkanoate synthesis regulator phasin|nr:hypothetical protein [Aeromonas caviae]BDN90810.1 hypothetical protein KAM497c_03540 [Aeromonas caviae]GJB05145.1 hypothetical protein KAM360_40880 [Aeromonas caviae]GKR72060.1 hypothetical protein KAM479_39810 [Aeromonas caviae]
MSLSAFNKVFNELSNAVGFKVKPHGLRHTWNDRFSELIEELIEAGQITYEEAEELRCWVQGWKENSDSAKSYTRAYRQRKAMQILLDLQKTRPRKCDAANNE